MEVSDNVSSLRLLIGICDFGLLDFFVYHKDTLKYPKICIIAVSVTGCGSAARPGANLFVTGLVC